MKLPLKFEPWQWSILFAVLLGNAIATPIGSFAEEDSFLISQNQISQHSQLQPFVNELPKANSENQVIRVGVMAIRGVDQNQTKWQPTLDYLSQNIPGYTFELVSLEFDTMEEVIAKQKIDFVLPNPGMYVELEWVYGARRIATLQNLRLGKPYTEFGAVIFRRKDRLALEELKDLKGSNETVQNWTTLAKRAFLLSINLVLLSISSSFCLPRTKN
jgi:hypothetical protein